MGRRFSSTNQKQSQNSGEQNGLGNAEFELQQRGQGDSTDGQGGETDAAGYRGVVRQGQRAENAEDQPQSYGAHARHNLLHEGGIPELFKGHSRDGADPVS